MSPPDLRGIAVVDAGATNTKVILFDRDLKLVAERKAASAHRPPPPYKWRDPEPMAALFREALPELDRILPIDMVVPSAHGAALALLDDGGGLALPVMDYTAEPPPEIVEGYRRIAPPFPETFCTLLPMALTHGLQVYWQQQALPDDFVRTRTILPWIQYVAYVLSGVAVSEISGLSCQSHLMDVRNNAPSSLARAQGWDKFYAPMARAWDVIGSLKPEFTGSGLQGRGQVLAGVHDSNANYLRYLASGRKAFTLLSTGTWIIGFDTATRLEDLDPARDTVSNTDVLGRPVACCRFFGGREFEIVADGAPAEAASVTCVRRLTERGAMALPSFTDSGGPVPGTGGSGRIVGPAPQSPEERASLAALYCALMVSEQLDAVGSRHDVIVDGPFAQNPVFLGLLAALRRPQPVVASDLRDGTTAGAAILALMSGNGTVPKIGIELRRVEAVELAALQNYRTQWKWSATRQ